MQRKVIIRNISVSRITWLSGSFCTGNQVTLRLNGISEESCGIQ